MVSRSAASQNDAELYLNRLKAQGCRVILRNCNIANEGDLSGVLSECASKFPSIKGVIQAAMVLQVRISPLTRRICTSDLDRTLYSST